MPAVGVDGRGGCGDGVEGGFGVDPQAAQAGVAALGHQDRERDSGLGQVCQPRVPQLVQCPAAGGFLEYFGGSPVGQPGPTGVGVEVGQRGLAGRGGGDIGQEQRAFPPLVQTLSGAPPRRCAVPRPFGPLAASFSRWDRSLILCAVDARPPGKTGLIDRCFVSRQNMNRRPRRIRFRAIRTEKPPTPGPDPAAQGPAGHSGPHPHRHRWEGRRLGGPPTGELTNGPAHQQRPGRRARF